MGPSDTEVVKATFNSLPHKLLVLPDETFALSLGEAVYHEELRNARVDKDEERTRTLGGSPSKAFHDFVSRETHHFIERRGTYTWSDGAGNFVDKLGISLLPMRYNAFRHSVLRAVVKRTIACWSGRHGRIQTNLEDYITSRDDFDFSVSPLGQ